MTSAIAFLSETRMTSFLKTLLDLPVFDAATQEAASTAANTALFELNETQLAAAAGGRRSNEKVGEVPVVTG